ncbi:tumor necrosis factor receptor superfamily member 4 [Salarias fasciatus]|uniref:Tumor necrosis factor receptor superfamily member 4-like n=1 Tax=Salarias fasciatus TaxID=181472 RepID=A0A672GTA6_SALFA|nr:tumor necrosis factor receptor superfamily member 4-like [Salarias fasciatus]
MNDTQSEVFPCDAQCCFVEETETFVHSEEANMTLPKQLVLIFMFCVFSLDACPKGHKTVKSKRGGTSCEPCSEGTFQPEESDLNYCEPCRPCDENAGSETKQSCTSETDTICQCREGFVGYDSYNDFCKCDIGSGLSPKDPSPQQQCSKCKEGYFTTGIDQQCKKWKTCDSGEVIKNGTATSDVTCSDEPKSDSSITTPGTTNQSTNVTNHRPPEGAQTPNKLTAHTTTDSPQRRTKKTGEQPTRPPSTGNHSGWTFLILGIAGLLVVLTAVTCVLHLIPCCKRTKTGTLQTKDSTCRRPVEESGDDSELSLKQNAEEP